MAKFKDDDIRVIEDDLERLRERTTVYISYKGDKGALHLCKELINNAIDEAMSPKSPCKNIQIVFNEKENRLTVSDDGRGIPFQHIIDVVTKLQSSSNFGKTKEGAEVSLKAGENGIGLTAINALSEFLTIIVTREGKRGTFNFVDGRLQGEPIYEQVDPNEHGTTAIFVPSEKYLGPCHIKEADLFSWLSLISHFVPSSKTIYYTPIKKKGDEKKTIKLKYANGPVKLLESNMKKPLLSTTMNFKSANPNVQICFNYDEADSTDGYNTISFCNWVNTIQHGEHVSGAKTGYCQAMMKIVPTYMTENEKKKWNITFEDIRLGLCTEIFLFHNDPQFTGQTKECVGNREIFKDVRDAVYKATIAYMKENAAEAKKISNYIKKNARARLEVSKIRKSDYKAMDSFEESVMSGYSPAIGKGYKELYIVEGDSAKGGVTGVRDAMTQAVFKIKGNPKNTYGIKLAEVLQNAEFKTLIKIIGTGIGKDFNLAQSKFDKIIIFVDSDIDGFNMTSLLSTFFLCFMPELVKAGMLYKAKAPLYILKDSKNKYILSKVEYYKIFADKVVENTTLIDSKGKKLSKEDMYTLIDSNKDYLLELEPLTQYFYTNPELIEFTLLYAPSPKFNYVLKKRFPELTYDEATNVIQGSIDGVYQYLVADQAFFDKCERLTKLIKDVNKSDIYYTMESNGYKSLTSLGMFFKNTKKYLPEIEDRIKGLGELDGEVMWETTLNPANRELIRLTIDDLERDLNTVKVLHGPDSKLRKAFMIDNNHKFNRDDLDN
nr:MAG TPA: DNA TOPOISOMERASE IV, B SUBUNIT [Myoviridae sp. ctNPX13]